MKQNELADKVGISKSHVSEIESGNRTPSLDVIEKYAAVFRVPVSSILFFSEQLGNAKSEKGIGSRTKQAIASKIITLLQVIEDRTQTDGVH